MTSGMSRLNLIKQFVKVAFSALLVLVVNVSYLTDCCLVIKTFVCVKVKLEMLSIDCLFACLTLVWLSKYLLPVHIS